MAEGKEEESKSSSKSNSGESVKLFVGQVPKRMTENEVLAMFKEFALVDQVNIITDKLTRASRGSNQPLPKFKFNFFPMCVVTCLRFAGCCFVICPSREEADKAVNACHNKITLPGVSVLHSSSFFL